MTRHVAKQLKRWVLIGVILGYFAPGSIALADAGLQLNPLRYDDTLVGTTVKNGYVDVSNPGDTTVTVTTHVKGFKQADLDGNLAFFDDKTLSDGIKPGLASFDLGPQESIRVTFSVNPGKLPQGGVYAALFFETEPAAASPTTTSVSETSDLGTLLILQNGGTGTTVGRISSFKMPWLQFGSGVHGTVTYQNLNRNGGGLAFTPQLSSRVLFLGSKKPLTGPFIMPTSSRSFHYVRSGSYFGLVPVTLTNNNGGGSVTAWGFACTGWYQLLLLVIVVTLGCYLVLLRLGKIRRQSVVSVPILQLLARTFKLFKKPKKSPKATSMDGLSRKA